LRGLDFGAPVSPDDLDCFLCSRRLSELSIFRSFGRMVGLHLAHSVAAGVSPALLSLAAGTAATTASNGTAFGFSC